MEYGGGSSVGGWGSAFGAAAEAGGRALTTPNRSTGRSPLSEGIGAGVGYGLNALFPGQKQKDRLIDTRTNEQRTVAGTGVNSLSQLQQDPRNFGLPGNADDINTPAGRHKWDIIQNTRRALSAQGMGKGGAGEIGQHAGIEADVLNRAVGQQYNQLLGQYSNMGAQGPAMQLDKTPAKPNPWAQIGAAILGPVAGAAGDRAFKGVWSI